MNPTLVNSIRLAPPASVPEEVSRQHLGVPAHGELSPHVRKLCESTREWFERHGDPWAGACRVGIAAFDDETIHLITGHCIDSRLLATGLREAAAEWAVVMAFSAGAAVDDAISRHWAEGRPDEAMFLNAFAISYVEHWREVAASEQASLAASRQQALLPRYSPGYDGWELADQAVLMELIASTDEFLAASNPPIELLDDGGLRPSKSTLTLHGLTPRVELRGRTSNWWESVAARMLVDQNPETRAGPVQYAFPVKALRKWSTQRLRVDRGLDGELDATFRFSGSTCANMGTPFEIDFRVIARQESDGDFRVSECTATPAAQDTGHRAMCAFLDDARSFLNRMTRFDWPVGRTLSQIVQWTPDTSPAGCLCTTTSRHHKWRVVFQTLHFALYQAATDT